MKMIKDVMDPNDQANNEGKSGANLGNLWSPPHLGSENTHSPFQVADSLLLGIYPVIPLIRANVG